MAFDGTLLIDGRVCTFLAVFFDMIRKRPGGLTNVETFVTIVGTQH